MVVGLCLTDFRAEGLFAPPPPSVSNSEMVHPDHVFHTNIIAFCQQNWYVQSAIYTDLFTLSIFSYFSNGIPAWL